MKPKTHCTRRHERGALRDGATPGAAITLVATALAWMAASAAVGAELEVEVVGLDDELEANVRAYLGIVALAEDMPPDAPNDDELASRVRRAHANARAEILAALKPFGYYAPDVRAALAPAPDGYTARYEIDPGQPVLLEEVEVVVSGPGRDVAAVQGVLAGLPIETGQVLDHGRYEELKSGLFDAAYNAGFLDARYERAEFLVRPEALEADVHLHLETGARYFFGRIDVEQDILNADFVERFVDIEAGEPFDPDRLIDMQLALGDSGYFSDVAVEVRREAARANRIPVVARTTPRPNQQLTIGVGYGTDTGPRLRLGIELRRLNRRGHRFQADLRTSARENAVAAEYRVPAGDRMTDYISYRASLGREEIGDFDAKQAGLGASWNDVWRDTQRSVYLEARREDFAVLEDPVQSETALYAGVRLSGKRADDPLHTRRGHAWSADVRTGTKEVAGSASFARLHVNGEYIRPLGEKGRLLLRGEYGAVRSDDFSELIPSQRFFAGGDRSVRGYEFESLGPQDMNGATIGGRYLAVGSIELDYLFYGDFGGAVFYDAGNASDDPMPSLLRAAGIGFRWRSPVGMLRIDFAHPLDDPEEDFRLHLSIGATF